MLWNRILLSRNNSSYLLAMTCLRGESFGMTNPSNSLSRNSIAFRSHSSNEFNVSRITGKPAHPSQWNANRFCCLTFMNPSAVDRNVPFWKSVSLYNLIFWSTKYLNCGSVVVCRNNRDCLQEPVYAYLITYCLPSKSFSCK